MAETAWSADAVFPYEGGYKYVYSFCFRFQLYERGAPYWSGASRYFFADEDLSKVKDFDWLGELLAFLRETKDELLLCPSPMRVLVFSLSPEMGIPSFDDLFSVVDWQPSQGIQPALL